MRAGTWPRPFGTRPAPQARTSSSSTWARRPGRYLCRRRGTADGPSSAPRATAVGDLAEAQDELRVLGHQLGRPRGVPGQLDLDVLEVGEVGRDDGVDVLLDHRSGGTAHRRQAMDDLDVRAVDLDV